MLFSTKQSKSETSTIGSHNQYRPIDRCGKKENRHGATEGIILEAVRGKAKPTLPTSVRIGTKEK
jgi:hypothetical protein